MGSNDRSSWDDGKCARNLVGHGYDFANLEEIFDGRLVVERVDRRNDYGESRFNALVEFDGQIINVTYTPRDGKARITSARRASKGERRTYHDRQVQEKPASRRP